MNIRAYIFAVNFIGFSGLVQGQKVQNNNQGVIVNTIVVPVYSTRPSDIEILDKYLENRAPLYSTPATPTVPYYDRFSHGYTEPLRDLGFMVTTTSVRVRKGPSTKSGTSDLLPANRPVRIPAGTLFTRNLTRKGLVDPSWVEVTYYDHAHEVETTGWVQLKFLKPNPVFGN